MRTCQAFGVPVGLSDHTLGIAVPTGTAARDGAAREALRQSRELEGPDHPFALEPDELKSLVKAVRDVEAALGNGRLEGPSEAESKEMYTLARRSVIAATDIPAGTVIDSEMLTVKRPGYGVKPRDIELLVGCLARSEPAR
jgi:sialic acid synthase SpsE